MDIVRGTVDRLRRSAEVEGSSSGFSTSHIITCLVGGRSVEISMPRPPNIVEGDEIVAAGPVKWGTLKARAYKNLTNGTYGRWEHGLVASFFAGVVFVGLFAMAAPPSVFITVPYLIWSFIFGPLRTFRAAARVMASSSKHTTAADEVRQEPEPRFRLEDPSPAPPPAAPPPLDAGTVSIACPKCGKRLKLNRALVGKKVKCPRTDCATVIDTSRLAV